MTHHTSFLGVSWAVVVLCITQSGDFPGNPVVKTLPSNAGGTGSIPGQGAKIPRALRPVPCGQEAKFKVETVL